MSTFNYTNRDFASIKADLLTRAASSIPEWTERDQSDFMMALIDLWAYEADIMHYYIDRAATEAFLATATQRDSVMALANLYDYTPNYIASATAAVSVYNTGNTPIVVAANTQLVASVNGTQTYFYVPTATTCASASSTSLTVVEGTRYTGQTMTNSNGSTVSDGTPGQQFSLYYNNVAPGSVSVYVSENGSSPTQWVKVDRLSTATNSDSVFTVKVAADGTTSVVFGNGVNGRIPATGAVITSNFTVSSGASGNVSANTITTFLGSAYPTLRVDGNPVAAGGGSNADSIAAIKAVLPSVFKTQGRAVTLQDYADLSSQAQGVSKAVATYAVGANTTGGSVTLYVVNPQVGYESYLTGSSAPIAIPQAIRDRVYNYVSPYSMLGVASIAVPATISTYSIYLYFDLYVRANYVQSYVTAAVTTAIQNFFTFDNVSFGQTVTLGDMYELINNVEGVGYCIITGFNTTSTPGSIIAGSAIPAVASPLPTQLPRLGNITINPIGGITASS